MKNFNLTRWERKKELDGLLFFAQSLSDMLFDYTLDTYKVPTLNTNSRASECIVFADLVKRGLTNPHALKPPIDEFIFSFREDPIIKSIFGRKKEQYIKNINEKIQTIKYMDELETILNLITDELSFKYLDEAKKMLVEAVCERPNEKKLILSLTQSFLTELIYSGYSKGYIFYKTNRFFFDDESRPMINSPHEIERYMDGFDLNEKKFDLIIKADECFKYFVTPMSNPKPRTERTIDRQFFEDKNEKSIFIELKDITALDAQSARNFAEIQMSNWASFLKYSVHKSDFSWDSDMLVYEATSNYSLTFGQRANAVHMRPEKEKEKLSAEIDKIMRIIGNDRLNNRSLGLIIGALNLHSEAVNAATEENQLFTFWSSIEGLLSPPGDVTRINHIVQSIEPFLIFDHISKLILDMQNNLRNCGRPKIFELIESIDEGINTFEKLAALISLEKNKKILESIYPLIDDNVLLKNRLFELSKKLNSARSIEKTIMDHKQRVEWHVNRIYRMGTI